MISSSESLALDSKILPPRSGSTCPDDLARIVDVVGLGRETDLKLIIKGCVVVDGHCRSPSRGLLSAHHLLSQGSRNTAPSSSEQARPSPDRGVEASQVAGKGRNRPPAELIADAMLETAIALIVGFAIGYGVREWLSRRRHRVERHRRQLL
jgi:hypothetical protein